MFDIHPIVWLQSWSSPFMTGFMNGVSLLGYTRACIALAVLLAFFFRLRPALALFVLLGVNGALTDVAKTTAALPRPDWVSGDVQRLALFVRNMPAPAGDAAPPPEDSYGFPSGHVSATTAFAVGLALLFRFRRTGWALVVAWIALMALSRMYLGRHFLGDVIGGVVVGLTSAGIAFAILRVGHLAKGLQTHRPWPVHRVMVIAAALAVSALIAGLPDTGDAGRLVGLSAGLLVLVNHDLFTPAGSIRGRVLLLMSAALGFGVVWWLTTLVPREEVLSRASALRFVVSALPTAAMLIVPAMLPRRLAS
jgi:membrane-associated phospholipid phosphatase